MTRQHRGRGTTRSKKSSSGNTNHNGGSKSFQRRNGSRRRSSPETRRPNAKHSLSQKRTLGHKRRISRQKRFGNKSRPSKSRNDRVLVVKSLTNSVRLSSQSIHNAWKRELGGLIRWYVNLPEYRDRRVDDALRNIETMYINNDCNVQATKNTLLETILQMSRHAKTTKTTADPSRWIQMQMVVENPFLGRVAIDGTCVIDGILYQTIRQGKGVILETTTRKGEGPAHSAKDWNVVVVPPWAVGQAFYINMKNESPIDLSCEMTIDGHSVANNAPVPAKEQRTIRPASHRYFETHEWRLTQSQRIPLQQYAVSGSSSPSKNKGAVQAQQRQQQQQQQQQQGRRGHRYNEKRPNYNGRVSLDDFPDPSTRGWTFTGSNEDSRVEFFEKKLNNGSLCKMDFYYTTGTVKTVLFHPTQRKTTQLFRKCAVSPEIFLKILENPRYHSGLGYHKRQHQGVTSYRAQQQTEAEDTEMDDESKAENNDEEENMETDSQQDVTYYAKNDDYDFESAGHTNRQTAMTQLQPTPEFQAWERATRQDWSCIHAKCFVSLRQYMRRRAMDGGSRPRADDERMSLPEMTSIVNVQAAQNATLSTKFHSTGPSSAPPRQSHVRMQRVKGLNDDPEWGTGPVFDLKLYYRAEATMSAQDNHNSNDNDDESNDDSMQDDKMNTSEDVEGLPLAEKLRDEMPLQEYKDEKIDQLHRWYQDCKAQDKDEANARVQEAQKGIQTARSAQMVDDHLKVYWDWHQESEWLS